MSVNEGLAVKPWRTRYRWWLILAAAVGVIAWWQLSAPRVTQKQYDRIRLGMTPADVALCMGGLPPDTKSIDLDEFWARECEMWPGSLKFDQMENWQNKSIAICVWYSEGKTVQKQLYFHKGWGWLAWLRGLLGR